MQVGDKVNAPHPLNWMGGETAPAEVVRITPAERLRGVGPGPDAVVPALAQVRYEDGSLSGPLALDALTPIGTDEAS
jgi:hypothetical protein